MYFLYTRFSKSKSLEYPGCLCPPFMAPLSFQRGTSYIWLSPSGWPPPIPQGFHRLLTEQHRKKAIKVTRLFTGPSSPLSYGCRPEPALNNSSSSGGPGLSHGPKEVRVHKINKIPLIHSFVIFCLSYCSCLLADLHFSGLTLLWFISQISARVISLSHICSCHFPATTLQWPPVALSDLFNVA